MELRTGYKRCEIGIIPEDWTQANIASQSDLITVGFVGSMSHLFTKGGVPLLRGQDVEPNRLNVSNTEFISSATHKLWSKSALKEGDVVITRVGASAGMACPIPGGIGEANAASLVIVRPTKTKLNPRFLSQLINSNFGKRQVESVLVGGAQPVINTATAANFQIALPSKLEQDAIATALSDVDALLAKIDQLITKKRDLKQAAMQQLLTGQTRLPGFSGEWEVRRLGDLLKVRHGRSQHEVEREDGIYPILASGGEIGRTNTFLYNKPSVLIGRKGTIDKPKYQDTPFWTVDTLFYTELSGSVQPKFIYYQFLMVDWRSYNEASGVPSLNASTIEAVEIPAPNLAEQTSIATVLSDMDAELAALEARRDKTRALKQGMMQALLTGRIRLVGGN